MIIIFEMSTLNLYDILGVKSDCDQKEIVKAYKRLVKKAHPDRGGDSELFEFITHAFNILNNAEKRKEYDNSFRISQQSGADHHTLRSQYKQQYDKPKTTIEEIAQAKIQFQKEFEDKNKEHNYYPENDKILTKEELHQRMKELEQLRIQEEIEYTPEKIFGKEQFDLAKFNAVFNKGRVNTDLIVKKDPNAFNTVGEYGTLNDYGKLYQSSGFEGDNFSAPIENDTITTLTKDDIQNIKDDETTFGHNKKELNYEDVLKQRLQERATETTKLNSMKFEDYDPILAKKGCEITNETEKILKSLTFEENNDIDAKFIKLLESNKVNMLEQIHKELEDE